MLCRPLRHLLGSPTLQRSACSWRARQRILARRRSCLKGLTIPVRVDIPLAQQIPMVSEAPVTAASLFGYNRFPPGSCLIGYAGESTDVQAVCSRLQASNATMLLVSRHQHRAMYCDQQLTATAAAGGLLSIRMSSPLFGQIAAEGKPSDCQNTGKFALHR